MPKLGGLPNQDSILTPPTVTLRVRVSGQVLGQTEAFAGVRDLARVSCLLHPSSCEETVCSYEASTSRLACE